MRRINLPPRVCVCGAIMVRWRYSNGRLEPPKRFAKRRFCSNACKSIGYLKLTKNKRRACLQCGDQLTRKRFNCGRWEERKVFARRRFCGNGCKRLYIDDPLTRADYGRYWAERLAAARARRRPRGVPAHWTQQDLEQHRKLIDDLAAGSREPLDVAAIRDRVEALLAHAEGVEARSLSDDGGAQMPAQDEHIKSNNREEWFQR